MGLGNGGELLTMKEYADKKVLLVKMSQDDR